MCGTTGRKELALLRSKVDNSSSNGVNLPKSKEDSTQTNYWSAEEVFLQYFICIHLLS